jgi:hypothetical protein
MFEHLVCLAQDPLNCAAASRNVIVAYYTKLDSATCVVAKSVVRWKLASMEIFNVGLCTGP